MTNRERLNEKVVHTEKILKWIKVLNDTDDHKQLGNAIWFLKHFTQDIEYLYSEMNKDSVVRFDKDLVQSFAQGELSYELQQMRQFNKTDWQLPIKENILSFWDEVDVRDKDDLEDGWDSGWVYVWTIEWVHLCTRYEDELEDFKNCERYLWNFTTFHFVRKTKNNTTNN